MPDSTLPSPTDDVALQNTARRVLGIERDALDALLVPNRLVAVLRD